MSHALTDNTDIAPTILELLGYDKDEIRGAGKSLVAENEPELTKRLMDFMRQSFTIGEPLPQGPPAPIDPEREEALRALGYLER